MNREVNYINGKNKSNPHLIEIKEEITMVDSNETIMYENGRDAGYSDGYDDGLKVGKTEILNDLMGVVLEWKASSDVVSCSTLMQLLQTRKNSIED